jgi:hypothetical protein
VGGGGVGVVGGADIGGADIGGADIAVAQQPSGAVETKRAPPSVGTEALPAPGDAAHPTATGDIADRSGEWPPGGATNHLTPLPLPTEHEWSSPSPSGDSLSSRSHSSTPSASRHVNVALSAFHRPDTQRLRRLSLDSKTPLADLCERFAVPRVGIEVFFPDFTSNTRLLLDDHPDSLAALVETRDAHAWPRAAPGLLLYLTYHYPDAARALDTGTRAPTEASSGAPSGAPVPTSVLVGASFLVRAHTVCVVLCV